ncbi:MAG TPA: transcription antitermination factor NusB [Candidatus Kryptonia bacterium]|nr:transcription antitermination factor NusB [Candidatus Kryptonia bacterium]
MGLRRKGRELALQALYQQELTGDLSDQALRMFWQHFDSADAVKEFALGLVHGVAERHVEIDALIAKASANWRLDRLSKVDVNILRLATFELLATPAVPPSVVINEAIEIARRFGTQESTVFVNGVLDQIATELGVKISATEMGNAVDD